MNTMNTDIFKVISSYLPQSIVTDRLQNPEAPDIEGKYRYGSLVFADISGFTKMSEKLSEMGKEGAEELTQILNRYFAHMLDIASTYHGIQMKFGGDAMLLLFLGENHAARGIRCALEMQKAMRKFHRVNTSKGIFKLEMSIGINSGEFLEAHVGKLPERLYFVFTGREINRTAEIEAVANAGQVVISSSTEEQLDENIEAVRINEGLYLVKSLHERVMKLPPHKLQPRDEEIDIVTEKLGYYLPARLRGRIRNNPDLPGAEGEHRRVAIMFINLLGATELIERYGGEQAAEITGILNNYFCMLQETVDKYGGVVVGSDLNVKGDKLLVMFGAPVAHEDDDKLAVLCALEINQRLKESGLPFKQRIGINSGYVFSGEVGSTWRKEYTVMGDAVNLAARVMGITEENNILVSQTTYSKISNDFITEALPPVQVKGKKEPVAIYRIIEKSDDDLLVSKSSTIEFVGREAEIIEIESLVEEAVSGKGQILAITGTAGIGKSRLTGELKYKWQAHGGLVFSGSCQSYGENTPFLPWIELFISFFNIYLTDSDKTRRKKVEYKMLSLCPNLKESLPLIGNLLNIPIPENSLLKSLDPKLRHQRLIDTILELILAQARKQPVIVHLQNLHWVDSASIELLNYVTRNIDKSAIVLCVEYRPSNQIILEASKQGNYKEMILSELSHAASLSMVRSITGMKDVPPELDTLIATKVQGNPLYIEEIVKSLMDAGYLKPDFNTGEYQLTGDLHGLEIPDSIEGVVMARLDQLDDKARNILKVISVIGQSFRTDIASYIYPYDISNKDLTNKLDHLVSLEILIREKEKSISKYTFRHMVTQEVAYDSLLFGQRRELHHKVGEYIEDHYASRLEEYYEFLCFHYVRTKDSLKGLEFSVKAGNKAKGMFTNNEAINYYRGALDLIENLPESMINLRALIENNLGDIYELVGQYDEALAIYRLSQKRFKRRQTRVGHHQYTAADIENILSGLMTTENTTMQAITLYRKQAMVHERKGEYDNALNLLDKGLSEIEEECDEKVHFFIARAGVLYRKGDFQNALEWCQQGLDIAQQVAEEDEVAHSYYLIGTIYTDLGETRQAIIYRRQALKIYVKIKDLLGQARVYNNLGVDYYYQGNWEKAKAYYRKSLEIRERIGDVNGVATVSNNLGEILSDQGYLDEALTSFLTCFETWERIGYSLGVGLANSNLGRLYTRKGEWKKSLTHLNQGLQIFKRLNSKAFTAELYQRLSELYLGSGDTEKAIRHCELSLELIDESKSIIMSAATKRILGQAYMIRGKLEQAEELLNEILITLNKSGNTYELAQTLWQLAFLYDRMQENSFRQQIERKIQQYVNKATKIYNRLGIDLATTKIAALSTRYQ